MTGFEARSPTCFISENWMSDGSALSVATLRVSPSTLEMLSVRSSEPRASKLASLHAPQVMDLLCFPITAATRLEICWVVKISVLYSFFTLKVVLN